MIIVNPDRTDLLINGSVPVCIETPRLLLRNWKKEDIPYFTHLNSDDRVKEFGHPSVDPNHPLYKHVLYRLER